MLKNAIACAVAAAAISAVVSTATLGADMKKMDAKMAGDVVVEHAWARASAGKAKTGAAYVTLKNGGTAGDRLVGVSAGVAKRVELHTHLMEGNVMKMRKIDGIDVPAGKTVALKPGGHHVMFMGLAAPFKEGASFPLTLTFEKGGEVTVMVSVGSVAAMGPGGMTMKDGGRHGHGKH